MIALAVLRWHRALAWGLVIANAVSGVWALWAHFEPRLRRRLLWGVIVVAQLFAFAQALTGTILISRYELEPARLHALYGFSAVIAVGIIYSYRTSSFMRGKEHMLYGGGCLFIMGLGLRETLALS